MQTRSHQTVQQAIATDTQMHHSRGIKTQPSHLQYDHIKKSTRNRETSIVTYAQFALNNQPTPTGRLNVPPLYRHRHQLPFV